MRFTYVLRRAAAAALLIGLVMGNAPLPAAAHGAQVKITDDSTGRTYTPQYSDVTVNADNSLSFDGYTVKNGTITYSDGAFNAFYNYQRIPIDRNNPAFRANASSLHVNGATPPPPPAAKPAPATAAPLASPDAGGGAIVAQGGGNIVAQGGGNIVAQGGGNIVAQGGGNIVAQGGGNIVAQGGGNIVAQGGGNFHVESLSGYATPPNIVNQCADARISLAYFALHAQTGNSLFSLSGADTGRSGLCNPARYADAVYDSSTIQNLVAFSFTCSDEPKISEALGLEGFTRQSFNNACEKTSYYVNGQPPATFAALRARVVAYAHAQMTGTTIGTTDSYGCTSPNLPAAVFAKQQLFFSNYKSVFNLDLSQASAFTCTNTLPNGLRRGDPSAIPVALQLRPPTPVKTPTPVVVAPVATPTPVALVRDQYGCTSADPAVGVFSFNGYTEYDPIAYPNLDLTQATRILCRSAIPSPGYANPNIPQTRFMQPTQTSPYAGIVTSQTGGSATNGYIGVNDGVVFTTSPADLNNVGLTLSLPTYSTHIYPDGLRHDIVAGSRLQGYTTKANLLAQRVGDLNPTCDQVVFVMRGYRYSTHVAVANRTDALAYQCANDLLSFGKLSGISYTFVP